MCSKRTEPFIDCEGYSHDIHTPTERWLWGGVEKAGKQHSASGRHY